jgi:hypothetical protein
VTTTGTDLVTLTVTYGAGEGGDGSDSFRLSGAKSYTVSVKHAYGENHCFSPWTITASAGGVSDSDSTNGDSCGEVGQIG